MSNYISGSAEIIRVAESVASEKGISKDAVIDAIEQGLIVAARKKYGNEYNIEASIDANKGKFSICRKLEIVDKVENIHQEISLDDVKKTIADANSFKIGDFVTQDLPPINLERLVAQVVKQVILQKVKVAEQEKQYDQFKDKVGDVVSGIVKKVSPRGVLLDLNGTEAFLERGDVLPYEYLNQNDRIRAVIKEVVRKENGVQVFLSRSSNEFMKKLFMQEVPEIYDGIIKIKSVAREPGSRSKIAVQSVESHLDPVGACVGVRGSRVQTIINELKGEKIDVIEWSEDPATFVVNALVPARVVKVVIDEEGDKIEAVVSEKEYSIAIGRRGQNARLASKLTGWNIDILTEESEAQLRKDETDKIYNLFIQLGLDDISARVLVAEGFRELEELLMVDPEELANIDNFDTDKVNNIISAAEKFIKTPQYKEEKWNKLGVDIEFQEIKKLTYEIMEVLIKNRVRTIKQIADLSRDEFKDFVDGVSDKDIDTIIMDAREQTFKEE